MKTKVKIHRKKFKFRSHKPGAIARRHILTKVKKKLEKEGYQIDVGEKLRHYFDVPKQRSVKRTRGLALLAGTVLMRETLSGVKVPRTSVGWRFVANKALAAARGDYKRRYPVTSKKKGVFYEPGGRGKENATVYSPAQRDVSAVRGAETLINYRVGSRLLRKYQVCNERRERRELLFASGKAGSGKKIKGERRRSEESKIRC